MNKKIKTKPEVRKNCFAYRADSKIGCAALKSLECKVGECPFYKSKERYEEELKKCEARKPSSFK